MKGLEKVALPPRSWASENSETVWAERMDATKFRLKNVPFFAYGVSFDDVVYVENGEALRTVMFSGHSTYRLFVLSGKLGEALSSYWSELEQLGCTYERASENFFAVDVPPNSDIHLVYEALQRGETNAIWEFEEGHCGYAV